MKKGGCLYLMLICHCPLAKHKVVLMALGPRKGYLLPSSQVRTLESSGEECNVLQLLSCYVQS